MGALCRTEFTGKESVTVSPGGCVGVKEVLVEGGMTIWRVTVYSIA